MSNSADRDGKQRRLGYFSLSVIAHVALLIVVMFMHVRRNSERQAEEGRSAQRGTVAAKSRPHHREQASNSKDPATGQPTEVMLADAQDPTGVEVPKESLAVIVPTKKLEGDMPVPSPTPFPTPMPVAEVKAKPVVAVAAAPKPKAPKTKAPAKKKAVAKLEKVEPALPEKLEPLPTEAYQPMSIKDVSPIDKSVPPEELTPMIADESVAPTPREEIPAPKQEAPVKREEVQYPAPVEEGLSGEAVNNAASAVPAEGTGLAPAGAGAAASGSDSGSGSGDSASNAPAMTGIVDASLRQPARGNPLPTYPQRDRLLGHQGTAVVTGRVDNNGVVSEIEVERSSGSSSIDQASMEAFKKWKFAPGPEATVRKSFAFSLNGEAQVARAQLGTR